MKRMKPFLVCLCLLIILFLQQCKSTNKVVYKFDDDIPESQRTLLIAQGNKGVVLYKQYCTECHGIFTNGNDSTTNFARVDIDDYGAKFLISDPKNHAFARKVSAPDLECILTYLRYRKQ